MSTPTIISTSNNQSITKTEPDYSIYYVTGRELLPPSISFLQNLDQVLKSNKVKVVQLREKELNSGNFFSLGKEAQRVCKKYGAKLLINDRLDIALAIGCGLHVGQKDLPIKVARSLLGPSQILGLSINTKEELVQALNDSKQYASENNGAKLVDYFGFGPIYETNSKKNCEPSLGTRGCRDLLEILGDSEIKVVGIGGVNLSTLPTILTQTPAYIASSTTNPTSTTFESFYRTLDGVAVISVLAATLTPLENALELAKIWEQSPQLPDLEEMRLFRSLIGVGSDKGVESLTLRKVAEMLGKLRKAGNPVVHHITNNVVTNDTANLTLAFSCSPIMSSSATEAPELSLIISSLLINLGTLNPDQIDAMLVAGKNANMNKKLCVFDPVGVGATSFRKNITKKLMGEIKFAVVKGNAGEIGALLGTSEVKARGVDSIGAGFKDPSSIVSSLALREKSIIAMSGETDYISNGVETFKLSNGHSYQGLITGSGCMATSAIACFASLPNVSPLMAAVAGITAINIAAEKAGLREDVKGPNTFRAALIDECWNLKEEDILERGRIERVSS